MIRVEIDTDMEELIHDIGYTEIRKIFEAEIEEEIDMAYEKGQDTEADKHF